MGFYRPLTKEESNKANNLASHPLQTSWWADFKSKRQVEAVNLGYFNNQKRLTRVIRTFIHKLPFNQKLIYYPRGPMFTRDDLAILYKLAFKKKAFMVKIEPYAQDNKTNQEIIKKLSLEFPLQASSLPLFPKYTLRLTLSQPKNKLWQSLPAKTRYNIRLAKRKGIKVFENNSLAAINRFVDLIKQTTLRHNFLAHSPDYYVDLFKSFQGSNIIRVLEAVYNHETIASWILFDWQDKLYYPYGASNYQYRQFMASNLLAWQAIEYAYDHQKSVFDLWGAAPPPNQDKCHPWYGFTRFKLAYTACYWPTIGSWDLVVNTQKYLIYSQAYKLRKQYLKSINSLSALIKRIV